MTPAKHLRIIFASPYLGASSIMHYSSNQCELFTHLKWLHTFFSSFSINYINTSTNSPLLYGQGVHYLYCCTAHLLNLLEHLEGKSAPSPGQSHSGKVLVGWAYWFGYCLHSSLPSDRITNTRWLFLAGTLEWTKTDPGLWVLGSFSSTQKFPSIDES